MRVSARVLAQASEPVPVSAQASVPVLALVLPTARVQAKARAQR
ncbi:MAG TPA: hypothetical protein VFJ70_19570 [Burkholderiales bacterium]|nr:hypothetical protein [Burkholderiales bacterium]